MTQLRATNSLRSWLSRGLAIQTFVGLGIVCVVVYILANLNLSSRQQALLEQKREVIEHLADEFSNDGNFKALDHKLNDFFYGRTDFILRLAIGDNIYTYGETPADGAEKYLRQSNFSLLTPGKSDQRMVAELYLDTTPDIRLRAVLAWTLLACALLGALVVSLIGNLLVRRALAPLSDIGQQAAMLSPNRMGDRLNEDGLTDEIRPLVLQFNAVLQRLERAYIQMEGFNADVAHELRTPLATLIGETEFALAGKRSFDELRETLGSNLEELQRLTAIVNDMLLLSQADRGIKARNVHASHLRDLTIEVLEYHEAEALDASVDMKVSGNEVAPIDRPLFQRAISNLISNAIRYSVKDSEVVVTISQPEPHHIKVAVRNRGQQIDSRHLPYLFHRFYRLDSSRTSDSNHHGLGLAIVAAIARMHGGETFAESDADSTEIGFTIATHIQNAA